MIRAKRIDEWGRWGELLAVVHNRTRFSKDDPPTQALDYFPKGLLTPAEVRAIRLAQEAAKPKREVIKVPFSVIRDIVLGPNSGSQ